MNNLAEILYGLRRKLFYGRAKDLSRRFGGRVREYRVQFLYTQKNAERRVEKGASRSDGRALKQRYAASKGNDTGGVARRDF